MQIIVRVKCSPEEYLGEQTQTNDARPMLTSAPLSGCPPPSTSAKSGRGGGSISGTMRTARLLLQDFIRPVTWRYRVAGDLLPEATVSQKIATGFLHVHDLQATILYLLGIDHEKLTYRHAGRDYRLTDVSGKVVKAILA